MTADAAFHELCGYTLGLRDPAFIHQHAVDTYAAQTADGRTKPVKITFALVGLHLMLENNFTGRQVQRVHMALAKRTRLWPSFPLPHDRGVMTVHDVLAAAPGPRRDAAIRAWCRSVWTAYGGCHSAVADLLRAHGFA